MNDFSKESEITRINVADLDFKTNIEDSQYGLNIIENLINIDDNIGVISCRYYFALMDNLNLDYIKEIYLKITKQKLN